MTSHDGSFTRELNLREFYWELTLVSYYTGSRRTQEDLLRPNGSAKFGNTVVNDWILINGDGNTVAYAKGLHIQASKMVESWHCSFDIVFTDNSGWGGSTLQVMGPNVESGQWSIVGGTGKLTMARGVIYKCWRDDHSTKLQIHAFYFPMYRKNAQHQGEEKNVWSW